MVGPLVFDLVKQHCAELLAEREMDRLAAVTRPEGRSRRSAIRFPRVFPPLNLNRGSSASHA